LTTRLIPLLLIIVTIIRVGLTIVEVIRTFHSLHKGICLFKQPKAQDPPSRSFISTLNLIALDLPTKMQLLQVSLLISSAALGAAEGYINSCSDPSTFQIPTLTADCPKQDETTVTSKLNLSDCFDLDGEELVPKRR
jgi:hypothetical protein